MENDIRSSVAQILAGDAYKLVLSKPSLKETPYIKVNILKKQEYYQAESYTKTQVFHRNLKKEEVQTFCEELLADTFLQLNAWSKEFEYQIRLTKKRKVFYSKNPARTSGMPKESTAHNRKKQYFLVEGTNIPPLVDMGIFTKEGKVAAPMYDKYRQINRFLEIVDDSLKKEKPDESRPLKVIDFGCGKSYLTFVLYYFLTEIRHYRVNMIGLDLKEDVILKCNAAAKKYGYDSLHFMVGDIGAYADDVPADMIITLHACDTATDYALYHAIRWKARRIFSVPCCQHELNSQFKGEKMQIIGRYGIVKERTMALMTDAIRCNLLECCGYKTHLMEFVDFENTPKNLLIRAVRSENAPRRISLGKKETVKEKCFAEVRELMETFHLDPTLYRLLKEQGYLSQYTDQ